MVCKKNYQTQKAGAPKPVGTPGTPTKSTPCTAASLASDSTLGYKIRVLLYDLCNMAKDSSCEARTSSTTDELYFSQPYFTPEEVNRVKNAIVDHEMPAFTMIEDEVDGDDFNTEAEATISPETATFQTVEETIHCQMARFFEKRRASGDARPCGPHTMAPLYQAVFGIGKHEIADEKFLGRLRRCGLTDDKKPEKRSETQTKKKKKKKEKA